MGSRWFSGGPPANRQVCARGPYRNFCVRTTQMLYLLTCCPSPVIRKAGRVEGVHLRHEYAIALDPQRRRRNPAHPCLESSLLIGQEP